ncbi:MAG: hypothetical protein JNK58_07335 [Phycisphaerae bacterium]|nr:hypothetical protein [Phycisphaerae bacterium]
MIPRCPRAFTLLDLMLTIAILAIISVVAAPSLRPNDSLKLISAATILAADLEYAQSATLEHPADPTVVRIDAEKKTYWLARASDPESPINRPDGSPYEVVFGAGANNYLAGIGLSAKELPASAVTFDAFGRLTHPDDAILTITSPSGDLNVRVVSATGSVYIGK